MTESINEQLSALLDGELPEEQEELLLRRLDRGAEHRATLVRYSLVGELVRGSAPGVAADGMLGRIHTAIEADQQDRAQSAVPRQVTGGRRGWAVSLTGAGLAASAVLVAVLILNQPGGVGEPDATPVAATAQPAAVTPAPVATAPPQSRRTVIAPQRLTTYMVSHGDYAGGLARQTMSSRVVASEPGYRRASYQGAVGGE